MVSPLLAQSALPGPPLTSPHGSRDPFPNPIPAEEGAIKVNFVEFAFILNKYDGVMREIVP
jgi:hypothetical protein